MKEIFYIITCSVLAVSCIHASEKDWSGIESLPISAVEIVMGELSAKDLVSVARTSKKMRELVQEEFERREGRLALLNDDVIANILIYLPDEDLQNLGKISPRMHKLVKFDIDRRMLVQREEFRKKLSDNGRKLKFASKDLAIIYPGVFDAPEFKDLQELDLGCNKLKQLPPQIFSPLKNLKDLTLTYNEFKQLSPEIFNQLKNLQELHLGGNKLKQLPPGIFSPLKNLQGLDLEGDQLTKLPSKIVSPLKNLQRLGLGSNQITQLSPEIFSQLTNLKELYLRDNQITRLPLEMLSRLKNFERLDLRGNPLEREYICELENNKLSSFHIRY